MRILDLSLSHEALEGSRRQKPKYIGQGARRVIILFTMPTVKIEKQTDLSPQECFNKVKTMLETDKELNKLDPGYKCDFDPGSLSGTAKGKQFTASMNISEAGGGSSVELNVELPFHLGLIKGLVQKTLQKKVDEILA